MPLGWSRGSFSISDEDSEPSDQPNTIFGFGRETDGDLTTVYIMPFWFPVLACAAATIFPPTLLKRFSLHTLLIATTLVAVVLGSLVYMASK